MAGAEGVDISVALCTFNGARFVREQLDSIAAQTVHIDEIVISDDGSTDATMEIIGQFQRDIAGREPSTVVTVLGPPAQPLGVAKNFSRALASTSGRVVLLSDQDDTWHPQKAELLVDALEASGAWLAHSDAALVDATGTDLGMTALEALRATGKEVKALESGQPFDALLRRNLITGATLAVDRRAVEAALPIPPGWIHDEWIAIISAALARTVYVPASLVSYRQHGNNEIGVHKASLRGRINRVLAPRGDRTLVLAERADALTRRLVELDAPNGTISAAREKQRFEARRAALPANRLARVPGVARLALTCGYPRYASQRWFDVARDLLQAEQSAGSAR